MDWRVIDRLSPEWPAALDDLEGLRHAGCEGRVKRLWLRGPANLRKVVLGAPVAVVGSRAATSYGQAMASELGSEFARVGTPVVSGGAFGIDQAAHRGALAAGGVTVCVLACGVDRAYPAAHYALIERISETGLVVSEQEPGVVPNRSRLMARNRIIAALATQTVVVEAAVRSGSLNTAAWAQLLGRDLCAVPGPVTSSVSAGCHDLIRHGQARLVTHATDVRP